MLYILMGNLNLQLISADCCYGRTSDHVMLLQNSTSCQTKAVDILVHIHMELSFHINFSSVFFYWCFHACQ